MKRRAVECSEEGKKSDPTFCVLPEDIQWEVFSYLSGFDACTAKNTCKEWCTKLGPKAQTWNQQEVFNVPSPYNEIRKYVTKAPIEDCWVVFAALHGYHCLLHRLCRMEEIFFESPVWSYVMAAAAYGGHMEIVSWLVYRIPHKLCNLIYFFAGCGGHLKTIQFLDGTFGRDLVHMRNSFFEGVAWGGHPSMMTVFRHRIGYSLDNGKMSNLAARNNQTNFLEMLIEDGNLKADAAFRGAARGGHLDLMRDLRVHAIQDNPSFAIAAARGGHLDVLNYLIEGGFSTGRESMITAASRGHLEIVQRLAEIIPAYLSQLISNLAAKKGHLHILKWIRNERRDVLTSGMFHFIIRSGRTNVVQWAIMQGVSTPPNVHLEAAARGRLEILKMLHKRLFRSVNFKPTLIMKQAIQNAHMDVLCWSRFLQYDDREIGLWRAVVSGDLETLQERHNGNGIFRLERHSRRSVHSAGWICECAALAGRMDVLVWARKNRYPWDTQTFECAAFGGHLHVLQYLRQEGCPWDERATASAAFGGHLHVLQWLYDHGCPYTVDSVAMGVSCGCHFQKEQWKRIHCKPRNVYAPANQVLGKYFDTIRWVHANMCNPSTSFLVYGPDCECHWQSFGMENNQIIWDKKHRNFSSQNHKKNYFPTRTSKFIRFIKSSPHN